MRRIQMAQSIEDLRRLARRRVPKMFFDYADSGSLAEQTLRANTADFEPIRLMPRMARDISERSLKADFAGETWSMPVAMSPVGMAGMQHANGEILAAAAAEKAGVPFTLSTLSICPIEALASVARKPFWFQLYVMRDQAFIRRLMDRAWAADVRTLVLTLDLQLLAPRYPDARNGLSAPPRINLNTIWQFATRPSWCLDMATTPHRGFGNIVGHVEGVTDARSLAAWVGEQFDPHLSWDSLSFIRDHWKGRLLMKGIMHPDDAVAAVEAGADGIVVSNHGGRQLDGALSTIQALPAIVAAVGKKTEVHIDGGVRTGVDIVRSLALGAKAVHVGRAWTWGLGAGGRRGVRRALEILRRDLDVTLALCGERDVKAIGPHNIAQIKAAGNGRAESRIRRL